MSVGIQHFLQKYYNGSLSDAVNSAITFASFKHIGQLRKDGTTPYIVHPIRVLNILVTAGQVSDDDTLVAGVLHDVLEDTNTLRSEIESEFGERVLSIVLDVTDNKSLPKQLRKELQIKNAPFISFSAKHVMLADKAANLYELLHSPPVDWAMPRKKEYVQWADSVVNGLRGVNKGMEDYYDSLREYWLAEEGSL